MNTTIKQAHKGQAGFTLVELAIVMIIIGLLITGVLKGQEMIANAQISSTVSQIKGIDAAASTFRDSYNAFPGDMANATTRLADCVAPCGNGNGNGVIGVNVGAAPALNNEAGFFFNQLASADLIAGMDGTNTLAWGNALLPASSGGGYMIGHTQTGVTGYTAGDLKRGHYLVINGTPADVGAATGALSATQAAKIDRKMDDGRSNTGVVFGNNNAACAAAGEYDEDTQNSLCAIAIRIQG